jgi:hypothetical protein
LHLDWWCSWGFKPLDDEMKFVAQEMGLEEQRIQLLNELKVSTKTRGQHFLG